MKLVNYGGFYMFNGTMMQYFEWFLLPKCKLWNEALNEAEKRENAYYPSGACGGCDPCVLFFQLPHRFLSASR